MQLLWLPIFAVLLCTTTTVGQVRFEYSTACTQCEEETCECDDGRDASDSGPGSSLWSCMLPKRAYRWHENSFTLIPADERELGWVSFSSTPYLMMNESHGATSSLSFHFLSGPTVTDLPPRVYDFSIGYQFRDTLSDWFSYDIAASLGVYSDFEDSARDGIRLPGHAVGFVHVAPDVDLVFGVDHLDRDDLALLPVAGIVLRNPEWGVVAEWLFPRPRVLVRLDDCHQLFFAAQIGGGSWDIERPDESDDVFTYSDYQITIGVNSEDDDGDYSSFEIGYVFQRDLTFRSAPRLELDDAFILRTVTHF